MKFLKRYRFLVPAEENFKLEELAQKCSMEIDCDHYIGHKSIMIPPSVLIKHGIQFVKVNKNKMTIHNS